MRIVVVCVLAMAVSGCDYVGSYLNAPKAPKIVSVDDTKSGPTFMACKGDIHITSAETGFRIEFVDEDGLTHVLYGIKKFSLADIPERIRSSIPEPQPDLYDFQNNDDRLPVYSDSGKSIHNGDTVVWKSGDQGRFVIDHDAKGNETGRHWERIWIRNTACDPPALYTPP